MKALKPRKLIPQPLRSPILPPFACLQTPSADLLHRADGLEGLAVVSMRAMVAYSPRSDWGRFDLQRRMLTTGPLRTQSGRKPLAQLCFHSAGDRRDIPSVCCKKSGESCQVEEVSQGRWASVNIGMKAACVCLCVGSVGIPDIAIQVDESAATILEESSVGSMNMHINENRRHEFGRNMKHVSGRSSTGPVVTQCTGGMSFCRRIHLRHENA